MLSSLRRGRSQARPVAIPDTAALLAALPDPVLALDRGGIVRFVNPAAEQFFGTGAAALCGTPLADLVVPHSPIFTLLDAVGLGDKARNLPGQLSGGQRQRVAIARALAPSPQLVLADEPTANLDSATGASIIDLMRRVQVQSRTTFIFATHDPQLMSHADETFVIRDGELVEHRKGDGR